MALQKYLLLPDVLMVHFWRYHLEICLIYELQEHLKDAPDMRLHLGLFPGAGVMFCQLYYLVVEAVAANVEAPVDFSALLAREAELLERYAVETEGLERWHRNLGW